MTLPALNAHLCRKCVTGAKRTWWELCMARLLLHSAFSNRNTAETNSYDYKFRYVHWSNVCPTLLLLWFLFPILKIKILISSVTSNLFPGKHYTFSKVRLWAINSKHYRRAWLFKNWEHKQWLLPCHDIGKGQNRLTRLVPEHGPPTATHPKSRSWSIFISSFSQARLIMAFPCWLLKSCNAHTYTRIQYSLIITGKRPACCFKLSH